MKSSYTLEISVYQLVTYKKCKMTVKVHTLVYRLADGERINITLPLMGVTRLEAAEKSDAGRVAPISACVFYQIDRLKSGFEAR